MTLLRAAALHYACSIATAGLLSLSTAYAVEPSGTAVRVVQAASATGVTGNRLLEVEGAIYMDDEVRTGPVGEAQIRFVDQTRLVVGPNSRMTIDRFVFDNSGTARQVSLTAAKGAFRFISGQSPSQAYSIRTPVMTIGVRGTQFDFSVRPGGETSFALFQGAATLCDAGGRCIDVREGCNVVVAPPAGGFQPVNAHPEKVQRFAAHFPYVRSQDRLAPEFRVDTSDCGVGRATFNDRRENRSTSERFERPAREPESPSD